MTKNTIAAAAKKAREGKSHWRVSSTLFSSLRKDVWLEPLEQFKGANLQTYQPKSAEEQIREELKAKKLPHYVDLGRFLMP